MAKRVIRLTESELKKFIAESVRQVLKENNMGGMPNIPFDSDIYSVSHENGETVIKVLGYFYEHDGVISHVEFCWLDFTLDEFRSSDENFLSDLECDVKQYQEDFEDQQKAYETFMSYNARPLPMEQVDENTPDGVYIDCM